MSKSLSKKISFRNLLLLLFISFSGAFSIYFANTTLQKQQNLQSKAAVPPERTNISKHLFIDTTLVDSILSTNYKIAVNPPTGFQEVIRPDPDKDWESSGYHYYSNVMDYNQPYDGTNYKYIQYYRRLPGAEMLNGLYCVALSNDGLNWIKPLFPGSAQYNGHDTNCTITPGATGFVLKDPNAPPNQRYKIFSVDAVGAARDGAYGIAGVSSNGLNFTSVQKRLGPYLITDTDNDGDTDRVAYEIDTQNIPIWDDSTNSYRFYIRGWNGTFNSSTETWKDNRRSVNYGQIVGTNLMATNTYILDEYQNPNPYYRSPRYRLTNELPVLMETNEQEWCQWIKGSACAVGPDLPNGDRASVDIYHTSAFKYPGVKNTYLSFPTLHYHFTDSSSLPARPIGLGRNDGVFEPQFAASRNGTTWERYKQIDANPAYIPQGIYNNTDMKMISMGQGMIFENNSIYQYFIALPRSHGGGFWWNGEYHDTKAGQCGDRPCSDVWAEMYKGGVFVAKQRLDGFASITSSNTTSPATITTVPFTFTGNTLLINGITGTGGHIKAAILNEAGVEIASYALAKSITMTGDFLDKKVTWEERNTIDEALKNNSIRLKFELKNARLFAFNIISVDNQPTNTPTPTATKTPTPTPTFPVSPTPTSTPTPTVIPTSTLTPTTTPLLTGSPTPTLLPTATPSPLPDDPVYIAKAKEDIVVDGSLIEYSKANSILFSSVKVYPLWNSKGLYLGFEVTDNFLEAVNSPFTCQNILERECTVWRDDSVDWFVDTKNNKGGQGNRDKSFMRTDDYQGIVNMANTRVDLRGQFLTRKPVFSWNGSWQSATTIDFTNYTVEVFIPWETIRVTNPQLGYKFGLGLAVNDRDSNGIVSSLWGEKGKSFQNASNWVEVQLSEMVNKKQLLKNPSLNDNGQYWEFGSEDISKVEGTRQSKVLSIKSLDDKAQGCWYQDVDVSGYRGKNVRLEGTMRNLRNLPTEYVPFITLNALKTDGTWQNNYGGIVSLSDVSGEATIYKIVLTQPIQVGNNVSTLRANFCMWKAQARQNVSITSLNLIVL